MPPPKDTVLVAWKKESPALPVGQSKSPDKGPRIVTKDEEGRAITEDERLRRLDFAIAEELDRQLNAGSPSKEGDAALGQATAENQHSRRANRSSTSSFWGISPERQLEKLREKYERVKADSAHYHNVAVQWQAQSTHDRNNYNRIFGQAREIEMELNATKKDVHNLDTELETTKHELAAVKQQLSDAVNLLEVRGKELKTLREEPGTCSKAPAEGGEAQVPGPISSPYDGADLKTPGSQEEVRALSKERDEMEKAMNYWKALALKDREEHAGTWVRLKKLEEDLEQANLENQTLKEELDEEKRKISTISELLSTTSLNATSRTRPVVAGPKDS